MSDPRTVLITGCSSGFGLATARLFLDRGWRVFATMRRPSPGLLPESPRLTVLQLDVTDAESIRRCLAEAGPLDALVNNAGVGLLGPLEGQAMPLIRETFETNVMGVIAMSQAVIPPMRARGEGVIVNVSSAVAFQPLPLVAAYAASKAAVNALTRSLAIELAPFGVRARLVQPGRSPETRFGSSARQRAPGGIPEAYASLLKVLMPPERDGSPALTQEADVSEAVWRAVTDAAAPLAIPAGADAIEMAAAGTH